jgi:multiple sugar transport system permease protein
MATVTTGRPGTGSRGFGRGRRAGWVMLAPVILAVLVIAVYPLLYTLAASFSDSTLGRPFQEWIGAAGFVEVFTDPAQFDTLWRSLVFAIPSAVLALVIGFFIALSLDVAVKSGKVIRVLLLLPLMTPPVMAGVIWKLMYAPTGGLFNNLLAGTSLVSEPVLLLGTSPSAMISLVVVDVWQWTPFCVLLIYAALQTLPTEVYEAAQIDGAGVFRTFRSVTFPLIVTSLVTVFLLKVVLSFKVFDLVFIMTSGGPGLDTTVASFSIYKTALQEFNLGTAAVQTIAFLVLVTIVITPISIYRSRLQKAEG